MADLFSMDLFDESFEPAETSDDSKEEQNVQSTTKELANWYVYDIKWLIENTFAFCSLENLSVLWGKTDTKTKKPFGSNISISLDCLFLTQ